MKLYKVIAYDFNGRIAKESDPHTWAECEDIQNEYMSYDHIGASSIAYVGKGEKNNEE